MREKRGSYINGFMEQPWDGGEINNDSLAEARWGSPGEPAKEETPAEAPAFNPGQQVGHGGAINGLSREQYRDKWMSSGVNSVQGAKDWLAQHGGTWLADNGRVRTPFGEELDMLINAKGSAAGVGAASAGWGGGGAAPAPAPMPRVSMPQTGTSGGNNWASDPRVLEMMAANPTAFKTAEDAVNWGKRYYGWTEGGSQPAQPAQPAAPAAAPNAPADPMQDPKGTLMRQLMTQMQQGLNVNPNDPVIKSQSEAYDAKAQRARKDYLADTAEASSPYATGKMRNEARMTSEKLGQNTAGFQAELMGRELSARRQEIQQALESMGNLLTEGERQALQRELAAADNALRRYGIDTQNSQFYAGLSQSDKHFYDSLSQSERLAMLDDSFRNRQLGQQDSHFQSQLGQQDSQFRDQMGFNTADRQAYWDSVRRGL